MQQYVIQKSTFGSRHELSNEKLLTKADTYSVGCGLDSGKGPFNVTLGIASVRRERIA